MKTSQQEKITIQNKLQEATLPIEFKNYRELCNFFDFLPTGGDTKKKRLEYIEHITTMETCKQKIIVHSFKNNIGNKDICQNGKDIIIEEFRRLNRRGEFIIAAGRRRLAKLFGFVNNRFFENEVIGFTDKFNEEILKLEHYDKELGQRLYNSIEYKCRYYTDKILKEMQDKGIILVDHAWYKTVLEFKKENETEFDDLEFVFQSNNTLEKCNFSEFQTLNRIRENLLKKLGCKDVSEVFQKKQDKKYYKQFRAETLKIMNTTAYELMEITYIDDSIDIYEEPFKRERMATLQKENNKIFRESFLKLQDEKIDKSKSGVSLGYFKFLLEQGEETLQVYPYEEGVYMENDEIHWYEDLHQEIPTKQAIEQHEKVVLPQKEQLKKTLDVVCTVKKLTVIYNNK